MKRCFNCLEDLTSNSCNNCGFKNSNLKLNNSALKPGTLLDGRYYLGRVLGQGGFGITYIASDEIMGGIVAVKEHYPKAIVQRAPNGLDVLTDNKTEFNDGLKKFTDEARALAKFKNHPNIVAVISYQRSNNTAYMIMEYVEGRTVKEILSGGKSLPVKDACEIILQALEGLSACHHQRLIHRDLTPDNIYITTQGKVKILDFGSARETVEGGENEFTQVLKKSYAPIEQFQHGQGQGPWTDIYSVGASFYRLVVGTPPAQNSVDRLLNDTLKLPSQIKKLPGWNTELENVLVRALKVRPEERYQNVDEFKVDLLNATLDEKKATKIPKVTPKNAPSSPAISEQKAQKIDAQTKDQPKSDQAKKNQNLFPIIGSIAAVLIISVITFNNFNEPSSALGINNGSGSIGTSITNPPDVQPSQDKSIGQGNPPPKRPPVSINPPPEKEQPPINDITPQEFYLASFVVTPSNAKIFIDGKKVALSGNRLKTGTHKVQVIASGYVTKNTTLNINNSNASKKYSLTKLVKPSIEDLDSLEKVLAAPTPSNAGLVELNKATGLGKVSYLPGLLNKNFYKELQFQELEFESRAGDINSSLMLGLASLKNTPNSKKNLTKARKYLKIASDSGSEIAKGYLALSYSCSLYPENCIENQAVKLLDSFDKNSLVGSYFYALYFTKLQNFKLANSMLSQAGLINIKSGLISNLSGEIQFGLGNRSRAVQHWKAGARVMDYQSMLNLGVYDNNSTYLENAYAEGLVDAKKYFALTYFSDEKTFNSIIKDLSTYNPSDAAFLNALKITSQGTVQKNKAKLATYLEICKENINCKALRFIVNFDPVNKANNKTISSIVNSKNLDLLAELKGGLINLQGNVFLEDGKYPQAIERFSAASKLGYLNSEVSLCNLYTFIKKDTVKALKSCDGAYKKGSRSPILLGTLAHTYLDKDFRGRINETKARGFLEASCTLGSGSSCCARSKLMKSNIDQKNYLEKAQNLNFKACSTQ
jgi:serine/threonine protein kinase